MPAATGPTLLVFTLGPPSDAGRRHLLARLRPPSRGAPGAAGEAGPARLLRAVFATCLAEGLAAGRASGLALRVACPEGLGVAADVAWVGQAGSSFAERFRSAVGDAFAAGAAPLVVVGTDSPGLGHRHVAAALELLAEDPDRVVLGPARDGGFYLLAATRPVDAALAATRFCQRLTLRQLRAALAAAGRSVVLLEPLADLDRRRDVERFAAAARRFGDAYRSVATALAGWLRDAARPLVPAHLGALRRCAVPVRAGRAPPGR